MRSKQVIKRFLLAILLGGPVLGAQAQSTGPLVVEERGSGGDLEPEAPEEDWEDDWMWPTLVLFTAVVALTVGLVVGRPARWHRVGRRCCGGIKGPSPQPPSACVSSVQYTAAHRGDQET